MMIVPSRPIYITFDCTDLFIYYFFYIITVQVTLLTFQYTRHTFIKFLRLYVPHVLRCDGDPTTEDFVGTQAGIFPLITLLLI